MQQLTPIYIFIEKQYLWYFAHVSINGWKLWKIFLLICIGFKAFPLWYREIISKRQNNNSCNNRGIFQKYHFKHANVLLTSEMVTEQKFVLQYDVPPLLAVGLEGLFGLSIISFLMLPMYFIHVPRKNISKYVVLCKMAIFSNVLKESRTPVRRYNLCFQRNACQAHNCSGVTLHSHKVPILNVFIIIAIITNLQHCLLQFCWSQRHQTAISDHSNGSFSKRNNAKIMNISGFG